MKPAWGAVVILALVATVLLVLPAAANPPAPDDEPRPTVIDAGDRLTGKPWGDQPNPLDAARLIRRKYMLEANRTAEADTLALTGSDRALVILVEFAGTDVFTWTAGVSTWDPIGKSSTNEAVKDGDGNVIRGTALRSSRRPGRLPTAHCCAIRFRAPSLRRIAPAR